MSSSDLITAVVIIVVAWAALIALVLGLLHAATTAPHPRRTSHLPLASAGEASPTALTSHAA